MGEIFAESLYDAVIDSLKVLPILFLAYLLVSFLSHDHSHKFSRFLSKNNRTSPLFGAFLGCVPQCGFSSVIADLYSRKDVTLGTLIAVFVATSDEAIPIMLSTPEKIPDLLILIAVKVLLAVLWGYAIDGAILASKKRRVAKKKYESEHEHDAGLHEHEHLHENEHAEDYHEHEHEVQEHHHECGHIHTEYCEDDCGHEHGHCCADNIFLDAFLHTFNILIYIFVATFALNLIIGYCGTSALENLLTANAFLQVIIASLIGLIPNCASSVLLVELYVFGSLSFPALLAGLTAGAGVGLVILWTRNKKHPLENLGILILQYLIGVASGMLCAAVMILFKIPF